MPNSEKKKPILYKDINLSELQEKKKGRLFIKTVSIIFIFPILIGVAIMSVMAAASSPNGIYFFFFMCSLPMGCIVYLLFSWLSYFRKK